MKSPLDIFVNEAYSQYQKSALETKQQQEALEQAHRASLISEFKDQLRMELGDELMQLLNIEYYIQEQRNEKHAYAVFVDEGVKWTIEHERYKKWGIVGKNTDYLSKVYFSKSSIAPNQLRAMLGAGLGVARNQHSAYELKKQIAKQEEEQSQKTRREAAEKRREQEEIELQKINADHEIIKALVENTRRIETEAMWRWPDSVASITYYAIRWCESSFYSEGELVAQFDNGYCTVDSLDKNGYITVYPTYIGMGRKLKLDMQIHAPIWEEKIATCVEDIPISLREHFSIRVEGIVDRYSNYAGENRFYFVEDATYQETLERNAIPVWWIRDLVDSQ